jgi:hypothetical protein
MLAERRDHFQKKGRTCRNLPVNSLCYISYGDTSGMSSVRLLRYMSGRAKG